LANVNREHFLKQREQELKKQEKKFNERLRKLSEEREELKKKQQEDAFQRDIEVAHSKNDKNGEHQIRIRVSELI
jgi:prefoldin subunit 5